MSRARSLHLWASIVVATAASGCDTVALRPRSTECSFATAITGGYGCQPMERMAAAEDEDAKRFVPSAGKASVYVVRPSIVGARRAWAIQIDGKPVGALAEHTFVLLTVEPGSHEVAVQTGENRHAVVVAVNAGENAFVEAIARIGWTESRAELHGIAIDAGAAAVRAARRVDSF